MTIFATAVLLLAAQDTPKAMTAIHATSLALAGGRLYVGTNTGEVNVYDARTREPVSVFSSERKSVVSQVTASSNGVAWIVSAKPNSIRDKFAGPEAPPNQALIFRTPDDRTYTIDLKPAGIDQPVRALAWFGPRLWMLTDFGAAFYNFRSNAIELGATFLPKSLAEEVSRSRVWVREPHLMLARPVSMRRNPRSTGLPFVSLFTVYKHDSNRWSNLGGFASNALDVEPERGLSVGEDGKIPPEARFSIVSETVDFDASGVTAVEGNNILNAPLFQQNWESLRQPLPGWFGEAGHPDPLWVQTVGEDIWFWDGTALLKHGRGKPIAAAFLPWNDPQMLPNAFLADAAGVWIASNVGVRRLEITQPEKDLGLGGFIAVPLGSHTEQTDNKQVDKLIKEVYRWRFAPEDLAGKDGAKLVSEVHKAVGVTLPASSQGILSSAAGTSVRDELRLGDVIYSAKGLAFYLGNGKTVEMKDGAVKNGLVWDRPFAIVRRFVK